MANDKQKLQDMKAMLQSNGEITIITVIALREFKKKYPHINKYAVISYFEDALKELIRDAKDIFLIRKKVK